MVIWDDREAQDNKTNRHTGYRWFQGPRFNVWVPIVTLPEFLPSHTRRSSLGSIWNTTRLSKVKKKETKYSRSRLRYYPRQAGGLTGCLARRHVSHPLASQQRRTLLHQQKRVGAGIPLLSIHNAKSDLV